MRNLRNKLLYGALALAFACLSAPLGAFEPEIKLTGPKDLVIAIEKRETVLEMGVAYLATETDAYMSQIEDLDNPFTFTDATPEEPVAAQDTGTEKPAEPEPVNYDDASVLKASAANFAQKVRGSLSRGDSIYLQLAGGSLVKPGASFSVRLPQAKGQTFTLTVTEITAGGYTLQIGEATKQFRLGGNSSSNSVQFSNP